MKWLTFISIFCLTAVQNHCDNNVNVNLETVLEFNPNEESDDLKIIDNLEDILKSVKRSVSNKQRHKNNTLRTQRKHSEYDNFRSADKTGREKENNPISISVVKYKKKLNPNIDHETIDTIQNVPNKDNTMSHAQIDGDNNEESRKNSEKWNPNIKNVAVLLRSLDDKDLDTLVDTVDNEVKKKLSDNNMDMSNTMTESIQFLKNVPKSVLRAYLYNFGTEKVEIVESNQEEPNELFVQLGKIMKTLNSAFQFVDTSNKNETPKDDISSTPEENTKDTEKLKKLPRFSKEMNKNDFKHVVQTAVQGLLNEKTSGDNTKKGQIIKAKLKRLWKNLNNSSPDQEATTQGPNTFDDKSIWAKLFKISYATTFKTTTKSSDIDDTNKGSPLKNRDEIDDYIDDNQPTTLSTTTKRPHRAKTTRIPILKEGKKQSKQKRYQTKHNNKNRHKNSPNSTKGREGKRGKNKHQSKRDKGKSKDKSKRNKQRNLNKRKQINTKSVNDYKQLNETTESSSIIDDQSIIGNETNIAVGKKNTAKRLVFWKPQYNSSPGITPKSDNSDESIEIQARADDSNEGISIEVEETDTESSYEPIVRSIDNDPFETENVYSTTTLDHRRTIAHVYERVIGNYKYTTKTKSLRRQDNKPQDKQTTKATVKQKLTTKIVGVSVTPDISSKIEKRIDNLEKKFENIEIFIKSMNATAPQTKKPCLNTKKTTIKCSKTTTKSITVNIKTATTNCSKATTKINNQTLPSNNTSNPIKATTSKTSVIATVKNENNIKDNEIVSAASNNTIKSTVGMQLRSLNVTTNATTSKYLIRFVTPISMRSGIVTTTSSKGIFINVVRS